MTLLPILLQTNTQGNMPNKANHDRVLCLSQPRALISNIIYHSLFFFIFNELRGGCTFC